MLFARNLVVCFATTHLLAQCIVSSLAESAGTGTHTLCVGQLVQISCSTNLSEPVDFAFQGIEDDMEETVVHNGLISAAWRSRSVIFMQNSNGTYVLQISNTRSDDIGVYRCIEDGGLGRVTRSIFLSVEYCSVTHDNNSMSDNSTTAPIFSCYTDTVLVIVLTVIVVVLALIVVFLCSTKWMRCCLCNRTSRRRKDNQLESEASETKPDESPQTQEIQCMITREEKSHVVFLEPVGETCRGERVRSVCVVDDRLYVARFKQTIIDVYDTLTMEHVDKLKVAGDGHAVPTSLAADETDKVLYVAYHGDKMMQTHCLNDAKTDRITWHLDSKPGNICYIGPYCYSDI